MPFLTPSMNTCAFVILGALALLPNSADAQDGPACSVLRATDLSRVLPGNISYNGFSSNDGTFALSNCNAIVSDDAFVSLRMISFVDRPSRSDSALQDSLLAQYDPNISSLTGEEITDTAVSYIEKGDLIFWSADSMKMYIIDEDPAQLDRARWIAGLVAAQLGLDKEAESGISWN